LTRAPKAKGFTLLATYQGCNEKLGVCYPPIKKTVEMRFPQ
jgi:thiol:disulfide interchange protein DsbD